MIAVGEQLQQGGDALLLPRQAAVYIEHLQGCNGTETKP